jgi:hypothetical protein
MNIWTADECEDEAVRVGVRTRVEKPSGTAGQLLDDDVIIAAAIRVLVLLRRGGRKWTRKPTPKLTAALSHLDRLCICASTHCRHAKIYISIIPLLH